MVPLSSNVLHQQAGRDICGRGETWGEKANSKRPAKKICLHNTSLGVSRNHFLWIIDAVCLIEILGRPKPVQVKSNNRIGLTFSRKHVAHQHSNPPRNHHLPRNASLLHHCEQTFSSFVSFPTLLIIFSWSIGPFYISHWLALFQLSIMPFRFDLPLLRITLYALLVGLLPSFTLSLGLK